MTLNVSSASVAFRIDEEKKKIFYHECPLDLTRYEYRLLSVLIKKPGRVYSREQLMNHVWEGRNELDRSGPHIKTLAN
jgi:two-component system catabolic regulation response regulator CreB